MSDALLESSYPKKYQAYFYTRILCLVQNKTINKDLL